MEERAPIRKAPGEELGASSFNIVGSNGESYYRGMSDFHKSMKRKIVVYARQINTDDEEHDGCSYLMIRTMLGKPGLGRRKAWVKLADGPGWRAKPGYGRLYFEGVVKPRPWWSPSWATKSRIRINSQATALLNDPTTILPTGMPPLASSDFAWGYAWLAKEEGQYGRYFTLKAEHESEVRSYIINEMSENYEVFTDSVAKKLYVFPNYESGQDLAEWWREASEECGDPTDEEELSEIAAEFESFPVYARLRWG